MTAIWNNFDDGSRSLENYADVLAKLGAATASSADEIAGGLEKFAAVAETVGLSYEYAASALATITAETRQSEDVVGTALKTIFARVENLKLGEHLEDGTTLGQYSEALAKVGISIKDSNGQLREMDNILSDIGTTWAILDRDQQVALAQQVAGIRQYSQFMALMDNWDVMEENVELAKEANGALETQHEIWATGIEGATGRVQEELNEIKNSLLGENDLLPLLNIAEGFLDFIGDLVDSLGGLPGLLSIIASVGLKIWGPQAAGALQGMISGMKSLYGGMTGQAQADRSAAIKESAGLSAKMFTDSGMGDTEATIMSQFSKDNAARVIDTEQAQGQLNGAYKETLHLLEQIIQKRQEEAQLAAQNTDKATEDLNKQKDNITDNYGKEETVTDANGKSVLKKQIALKDATGKFTGEKIATTDLTEELDKAGKYDSQVDDLGRSGQSSGSIQKEAASIMKASRSSVKGIKGTKEYETERKALEAQSKSYTKLKAAIANHDKVKKASYKSDKEKNAAIKKSREELNKATKEFKKNSKEIKVADNTVKKYNKSTGISEKELKGVTDASAKEADAIKKSDTAKKNAKNTQDAYNKKLEEGKKAGQGWATSFVAGMQGAASAAAGVQMMIGAVDSLSTAIADGSAGFSDYLSAITSIGFALPMLMSGLQGMAKTLKLNVIWEKALVGIKKIKMALEKKAAGEAMTNAGKEIAAENAKKPSKIAGMLLDIGKWLAKGPPGWVIALASLAAIAGLGIAIGVSANVKKEEKQQEEEDNKQIETAESALEVAEGWNEESQAMDDLIAKHNELAKANDKTIEGQKALKEAQQAIIDQVPQLIEKYKELDEEYKGLDLSKDITLLEGAAANKDVALIEQLTNDIDAKIAKETSQIARDGQDGAMGRTAAAMAEAQGDVSDGKYTVHVGDSTNQEGAIRLANKLGTEYETGGWFGSGAGVDIELNTTDPKEFAKQYEKLQEFVEEMEAAGLTNDDTYKEVKEIVDASAEQYAKLQTLIKDGRAYEIQEKANEIGFDPSTIQTYAQYIEQKEKLVKATVDAGVATKEEAEAWVQANKALSEYATLEKRAETYGAKYGKAYAETIKNYAKDLENEDELKAFLKIDFDKFQVKEQWDELTKYIQHLDKAEMLQKEVTAITTAEKNLKSNGSVKDYQKLQESLSWGKNGLSDYSAFLAKSYGEQKAYLEDIKLKKAEAAQIEYNNALKKLELTEQEYLLQLEQAKLNGDTFLQAQINADLYNLRQKIEQTKVSIELAKIEAKQAKEAQKQRIRDFENSKEAYEDEYDAYRHINEISEDLSRTMSRLADAKDHAYGGDYLALLNQEIRGLEVENDLLDKTIELADKRAAAHKKELASDYGAEFDSFGNIQNYNDIQVKYLQRLAELEGSKGKDSEEYKAKKEEYDDFINLAENYNEDLEKSEEATDQKATNMREILDKKLEGIEYKVNIKLEVEQHELNVLERQLARLDDDAYDGAARIKNMTTQTGVAYNKQQINAQGIKDTLKTAKVSDEDIAKYMAGDGTVLGKYNLSSGTIEQLEEFTNGFIDAQEQMEELSQSIKDEVMVTFEAWHEKIADVGAAIEAQGELINNYKNIIDIVGKDKLGIDDATLKSMEQASQAVASASLDNAKKQKETTEAALGEARSKKNLYKEGSEMYEFWAAREEELSKQLDEDTASFMSAWENALTTAYETFAAETERAVKKFSDTLAGTKFDSMDELSKEFEWQKEASDRYLESYEKAYELSKLNRKIQKDIDSSDNVRAQKIMRDMQAEIAAKQADGVEMSQHDLEILQKKYDLRLAEIALEEAQNAKSIVRLQRDSEGNFGYVYTADQSNIDNAEQNYEDKLYAMQKSNDDYIESLSEQIISNRKAMEEEIAAIDVTAYASKEEYLQAVQDITTKYQEKENYLLGEIQKTIESNKDIYENDVQEFGSFVGQQEATSDLWVLDFNETSLSIIGGFNSIEETQRSMTAAIGNPAEGTGLLGQLDSAYSTLDTNVNKYMGQAGTSVSGFADTVKTALYGEDGKGGAVGNVNDLTDKTKEYANTAQSKFTQNANNVTAWYKTFGAKIKEGQTKVDNLETALGKLKDVSITVKTDVGGKDQVDELTKAINGIENAIKKLQNTDFKITANVSVSTLGSGGGGEGPDLGSYTYHIGNTSKKASEAGFVQLRDSSGNYVGYAHKDSLELNDGEDMANLTSNDQFYKYLVYDGNSDSLLGGVEGLQEVTSKTGFTFNSKNFLSFDGNYSDLWTDDEKLLYSALEDRAGRLYIGKTPYFGFKDSHGDTYFASKNALYESPGVGEQPSIKANVKYYKALNYKAFDTGGYTGQWGPEGRLAMLHQKEIVLNAHDTANLLTAVDIVRSMADKLEMNASLASQGIAGLTASIAPYHGGDTLEQNVTIHAEFPNATNHSEIEEAFGNLVNLASQYANRK